MQTGRNRRKSGRGVFDASSGPTWRRAVGGGRDRGYARCGLFPARSLPWRIAGLVVVAGLKADDGMDLIKKVPIWAWFVLGIGVLLLFGETKVSVGNITVGGEDLGGFEYDSSKD